MHNVLIQPPNREAMIRWLLRKPSQLVKTITPFGRVLLLTVLPMFVITVTITALAGDIRGVMTLVLPPILGLGIGLMGK